MRESFSRKAAGSLSGSFSVVDGSLGKLSLLPDEIFLRNVLHICPVIMLQKWYKVA